MTTLLGRRRNVPELRSGEPRSGAGSASGSPSTRSSRAPPPTSSSSRWSAATRALADAGLETRLVLQIHDELLFEGPEAEVDEAAKIAEREMVAAFELDPPLAVDVGIGPDWLAAK